MSTRANIKIVQNVADGESSVFWLYHHHDGYPRGLGASLLETLKGINFFDENRHFNAASVATALLKIDEPLYKDNKPADRNEFELTDGLHGDVEFLYTITIHADGFKSLRCNPVDREGGKSVIGCEIDLSKIENEAKVFNAIEHMDTARWFSQLPENERTELVGECVEFVIPEKWGAFLDRKWKAANR